MTDLDRTAEAIRAVCEEVRDLLVRKNRLYGNSAFAPMAVFSTADWRERLAVRMDDKLSRIVHSQDDDTDDSRLDLIGYLLLDRAGTWLERQTDATTCREVTRFTSAQEERTECGEGESTTGVTQGSTEGPRMCGACGEELRFNTEDCLYWCGNLVCSRCGEAQ